jgi:hypothetical protein
MSDFITNEWILVKLPIVKLHEYIFIGSQVAISEGGKAMKLLGCYMQTLIKVTRLLYADFN